MIVLKRFERGYCSEKEANLKAHYLEGFKEKSYEERS